MRNLMSVIN